MSGRRDPGSLEALARPLYEAREYADVAALLEPAAADVALRHAQLAFWLADAWRRLGRGAEARDLLDRAAAAFARRGNDALHRHRLNLYSMLHFEAGSVAAAEAACRELLTGASEAGDDDFVARANNNLGVIYTLQARWEEAIACYERAMAAYRNLGRRRGLAQCHQNLGITYRELEFAPKADQHFLQAIRYASVDGSEDEVARAEQERALLIYLAHRDAPLARATAERALERFERLGERGWMADTLRVLGMIELGEGDMARAQQLLMAALKRARSAQLSLVEAETLEVLAAVLASLQDAEGATSMRGEAQRLFESIGAGTWGRLTRERVARLAELPMQRAGA